MMNADNNYNYCHVVGRTDIGCKRQANEDNMGSRMTKNGLIAVVCDGMGGHVGGATASHIAVETILDFLDEKFYEDPRIAIGEAIDAANRAILRQAGMQPMLKGMGSTCVLLIVREGKVYSGHVGDSRIYLVRNHRIRQLTKDHSYVQMLVDMHQLSPEQAEHHPRKNEITNALGIPEMKPATVMPDALLPEAGDCFLLCSDGLSGMVTDKEIEKVISRQTEMKAQERADCLIQKAKEHGGLDNITVQLVEFSVTPSPVNRTKKNKLPIFIASSVLFLLLIATAIFLYRKPKPEVVNRDKVVKTFSDSLYFEPGKIFLRVQYGPDRTIIFLNEKEIWTDASILCKDSLRCDTNVIIQDNAFFAFKEKFFSNDVIFSLSNEKTIYQFNIPVLKIAKKNAEEKTPQQAVHPSNNEQKTPSEKKSDEAKGSFTSYVYNAAVADSISYSADLVFKAEDQCLRFIEGNTPQYIANGQIYQIQGDYVPFEVTNVEFDDKLFTKKEAKGVYDFYYQTQEPKENTSISFIVKKQESETSSKIYKIIIHLKKK